MPISIRFHESGQYLVGTFTGSIRDHELVPAYADFYSRNHIPLNMGELVDLSAADLSNLTHAGLASLARWSDDLLRSRGETTRKSAFYIPGLPGRSKLVIYEVLVQESPEITRTFSNREDAVRWLMDDTPASATSEPTR